MFSSIKNRLRDDRIAAATNQPTTASRAQEKLLGFLYVPPLDDIASVLMMGIFVWQYSGGFVVRIVRGQLAHSREVKFQEGLLKARSDYKEAAHAKRLARKADFRTFETATSKEMTKEVDRAADDFDGDFDNLGKKTLMDAVHKGAQAGRRDRASGVVGERLQEQLKATRDHLHDNGITYEFQSQLFGTKRPENLSDTSIREIIYIMENGFKDPISLNLGLPHLSPRAIASAVAIRRIKDFDSPTLPVDDNVAAVSKFVDHETAQNFNFLRLAVEADDIGIFRREAERDLDRRSPEAARDLYQSSGKELAVIEPGLGYADIGRGLAD